MEASLPFPGVLARLGTGVTLLVGTPGASRLALPFCAPFLIEGKSVVAVDGANCFNLYRLTEWAKQRRLSSPALLNRLRIARAFTCFQLATILHHIGGEMERYRASQLILTGLPDCFYDEELSEPEARNTFARCRGSLIHLARQFTVLVFSDAPTHPVGGRIRFLDSLVALARFVFEVHYTEPVAFVPMKAPGLLTLSSEESGDSGESEDSVHGKNAADR